MYEPIIAQLYGAVKERYHNQLATVATLHFCPSLDTPIDILVQSYADYPNGAYSTPVSLNLSRKFGLTNSIVVASP